MDSWVPSACLLCSNGCGLDIAVKDGRIEGSGLVRKIVSITADSDRRVCTALRESFMID